VSGPSRTAKKIARFILLIDALPRLRGVLPPQAAAAVERILRASGAFRTREIEMMRAAWTQRFYVRVEGLLGGRGQLLWFGLRKRFVADEVQAALDAGVTQLLVVGAGFDPLAAVVAQRRPDVLCVEIDAPPTAEPKRKGLAEGGLTQPNLHVLAVDLATHPLADALHAVPWRADARSVVVAEGLLMYLRPLDVERFFGALAGSTGPGSRIVFTAIDADERGRPRLGVLDGPIRFLLRLVGEAMRWGIRPSDLPSFLERLGWHITAQPDVVTLRKNVLDPLGLHEEPVAPYEHLAVAERSRGRF
jgi:methyltransferase (TIGR00027 family)